MPISIPKCSCIANLPELKIEYCPLHKAAPELFEIVDALMGQREQVVHHKACHCISCRAVKVLFQARGRATPERGPEVVKAAKP
jgi:hypothetical protein